MKKTPDKRNFKRLKTNSFHIEYKIINGTGVYKADVINVSAGGICFLRASILEKGNILQIKFPFRSKKVILTAEIIRIEGREVAVKFLDEEHQIERFVENFNIEFLGLRSKDDKHGLPDNSEIKQEKENYNNIFNDIESD